MHAPDESPLRSADLPFVVRVYRWLLAVTLPRVFHARFADEMVSVFADMQGAGTARGPLAALRALGRELPGLYRLAWTERRAERMARRRPQQVPATGTPMTETLLRDIVVATRRLWRAPLFSTVVIATLALGIGANTAIFSIVYGVLLRPLALAHPEQLVVVGEGVTDGGPYDYGDTSIGSFFDWRRGVKSARLAALSPTAATLTGHGDPERITGIIETAGLFDLLGVPAALGRTLNESDENPSAAPVVVLSHALWRRTFGSQPDIVGKSIVLDGSARRIVGVMPASFTFPDATAEFFMPAQYSPAARANRDQYQISAVGRLLPGATMERLRAELAAVAASLRRDWPMYNGNLSLVALPLHESVTGDVRTRLSIIMGAVAFVLLIACANIGNLMLSRAVARRREIAIHQALGAGRGRIVRQLLTESMILALAGGAAGVMTARLFLSLMLAAQATTNLPRVDSIALDGTALLFTFGVALVAGLFFGSFPVWQLVNARSTEALKSGTRGTSAHQWVRNALVVSELALAMVLLTGAGLLLRSFALLEQVDPGIAAQGILTFRVSSRNIRADFFSQTLEQIRAIPGVRAAAVVSQLPITGRGAGAWFNRIDKPVPPGTKPRGEAYRVISPEYFATVGIPLVAGRYLNSSDTRENAGVVINEALARRYYPNENPVGKPVYLGAPDNRLFDQALIVGVVGDTRDAGLGLDPLPTVYAPLAVMPGWSSLSYVIRTSVPPMSVAARATAIIHRMNPELPVRNIGLLESAVGESTAPARWSMTLLSTFAALAFVMAALGVFGVLSYNVAQRTREIGIRSALGATPGAVRQLVVRQGLALVSGGLLAGGAAAFLLTRLMESMLFGVPASDPVTFGVVASLLVAVGLLAAYIPARRATMLDPVQALRSE